MVNDYAKNLHFNVILPLQPQATKKQILQTLAQEAADHTNLSETAILKELIEKEDFSPSAIGDGIAVPNLKVKTLRTPFIALTTLKTPVDFNAVDEIPVDIVALVLSPQNDGATHLRRLSRVSRLLKNQGLHKKIHGTHDADVIRSLLMDPEGWLLAA